MGTGPSASSSGYSLLYRQPDGSPIGPGRSDPGLSIEATPKGSGGIVGPGGEKPLRAQLTRALRASQVRPSTGSEVTSKPWSIQPASGAEPAALKPPDMPPFMLARLL